MPPPTGPRRPRKNARSAHRTGSGLAQRDEAALGTLLEATLEMVRQWSTASARGQRRIFPDLRGVDLYRRLKAPLPVRGQPAKNILAQVRREILPFLRDNGHPRFMGYVMSPPSAAGIAGDLLASALDQNLTAWRSAPVATELERLVVDWLRQLAGFPHGAGGLLTSGGSMANFIALAVARTRHAPRETVRAGLGRLGHRMMTIYVSDQVHMSIPRAAQLLGLGAAAVRVLRSDSRFRLDPDVLERAVDADRKQGHLPFCVVASAGTAGTGAIDPLVRLGRLARRQRLWLHVDAAYGGPLRLSSRYRSMVTGLGDADSASLDPHKWLYAPLDVGCVLFREADAPLATFSTHGDYAEVMENNRREAHTFFHHGPDLSRRFRALKVWFILKYHGTARIGRRMEEEMELARHLGALAQNHDETELMAPVETSIVCFRYVPPVLRQKSSRRELGSRADELNQRLLMALQRNGRAYLSSTRLRGRLALRACIINFRTTRQDMEMVFQEVLKEGRRLLKDGKKHDTDGG